MMGCGKTTIGKELAKKLDCDFVDCDKYLEKNKNITIKECFEISEEYFRNLETECLKEIAINKNQIIATGGGVILREENVKLFENDIIIFINRPIENILFDINKEERPLIKNGNDEKIIGIYNKRIDLYKKSCDIEITNNRDICDIIENIIKEIENY